MNPKEKNRTELLIKDIYKRLQILRIELNLLSIEYRGITAIAKQLADFRKNKMTLLLQNDFNCEDVFWKWSEQSERYYGLGKSIYSIWQGKAKQFNEHIESLKLYLTQLGIDISALADISLTNINETATVEWDNTIDGFKENIENSNGNQ